MPSITLRQKMLHFVQNVQFYMACEVIQPYWKTFEQKLLQVGGTGRWVCVCGRGGGGGPWFFPQPVQLGFMDSLISLLLLLLLLLPLRSHLPANR
jgi:Gamma tubulin complex component C-terminal